MLQELGDGSRMADCLETRGWSGAGEGCQPGIIQRARSRQAVRPRNVAAEPASAFLVAGRSRVGLPSTSAPYPAVTLSDARGHGERAHCRRSARTASRCRSLRWRCRSGYSARHQPITRQRSPIPLAVRDAGAGWSWPHRYGGASRVRKSTVHPGCWAGGPGASAVR